MVGSRTGAVGDVSRHCIRGALDIRRQRGGKGVATALGVLLVLLPISAGIGFVTWLIVLALTRISSMGSLLGGLLAIISSFFMGRPLAYSLLGVGLLLAMLWTHRGNIERILKRKENTV